MIRLRPLIPVLLLLMLPLIGVQAQNPPPQFAYAIAGLSSYLGKPLTINDLDSWSYQQNLYTDTALGCKYVFGQPRPEGISAFTFTMIYKGVTYDYRVSADGSIKFPCVPEGGGQVQAQPTAQASNCPADYAGFLAPHLQAGGQARIETGGTPNRLRAQPGVNAQQIGMIQPGETVGIINGPVCEAASHIIWWQVNDNGTMGWTAEGQLPNSYFLSPIGSSLPAERDLILTSNVGTLVPLTTISLAGVSSISFSPDNKMIALGGLSGLAVYDMSTLSLITQLGDISQPVTAVVFSSDSKYLAYSKQDGTLQLVTVAGQTRASLPRSGAEPINDLAFTPAQGSMLAAGTGAAQGTPSSWQVFDALSSKLVSGQPTSAWVRAIAYSPDGSLFAWLDSALHVVLVASGASIRTTTLSQPPLGGLAWRPTVSGGQQTHTLAFADGETIRMDNLDSNVEQTYTGDPGFLPNVIAFSKDGSLLAAMNIPGNTTTASTVNIFDTDTSDLITSTPLNASKTLAFSPDGTILAIASDDEVVLLGVSSSTENAAG